MHHLEVKCNVQVGVEMFLSQSFVINDEFYEEYAKSSEEE